jgi:tetratricopeptide (TPR) repeat protein
MSINDQNSALQELESIPTKFRDSKIYFLLGKQYKSSNLKTNAINAFKQSLLLLPTSIETIEQLIILGVESGQIISVVDEAIRDKKNAVLFESGWLHTLIIALSSKRNSDYQRSVSHFQALNKLFPKNTYVLTQTIENEHDSENISNSLFFYKQLRRLNTILPIKKCEILGKVLFLNKEEVELNKLANEMLEINNNNNNNRVSKTNASCWMVAAMYSELKNDQDKTLLFIEKVFVYFVFKIYIVNYFNNNNNNYYFY